MSHPVFAPGNVAVITGAAMGIGLAAAKRFASLGMKVCMADTDADELAAAVAGLNGAEVMTAVTDVSDLAAVEGLRDAVAARFGVADLLFNNAVTRIGGGVWEDLDDWRKSMDVNYWGPVYGTRAFAPAMIERGGPAMIVNAGSKQGITNPPGNAAYNVTKAALKHYTEALQHNLRNTEGCQVTAHLLVPGWTTTGKKQHQPGAWLPEQVVDYMVAALERGDFYIVCPDNEVTTEMDNQRILWAAGDITENRAPLSRWHPDYKVAFEDYAAGKG
ncbi:MAG: SDR family NAD(P)-dependent oxidoreductase [Rhodospirillaceae bacterium]